MDLLLLGAGMGIVGGLYPSPLHLIAISQIGLNRWRRAIFTLLVLPLLSDAALLLVTLLFYQYIPHRASHYVAYVGGTCLLVFAGYSLAKIRGKSSEQLADSTGLTYAGLSAAMLAELTAPGTWIYWIAVAGPILAEGRRQGYWHVVPFFAGGLVGYYAAALFSVWLLAWGANLHKGLRQRLFLIANLLLVAIGVSYLIRAKLSS